MGSEVSTEIQSRIIVAKLAVELGWKFDYIESLTLEQIGDVLSYMSAKSELESRV